MKSGANNRNLEEGKGIRLNEKSEGVELALTDGIGFGAVLCAESAQCPALSLLLTLSVLKLKSFSFFFAFFGPRCSVSASEKNLCFSVRFYYRTGFVSLSKPKKKKKRETVLLPHV